MKIFQTEDSMEVFFCIFINFVNSIIGNSDWEDTKISE